MMIAAVALGAMLPMAANADETISTDTQLDADKSVSGTLYLANGATLDLNGHNLTVNEIAPSDDDDVEGYKFLEYIQSDGTQWLNTGYTPAGSDRVVMKVMPMNFPAGMYRIYFCSRGADSTNSFLAGIYADNRFRVDHKASSGAEESNYSFSAGTQYEISVDGESGKCKINGTDVLTVVTGAYETASGPFSILGAHTSGANLGDKKGTALTHIPNCGIYSFQVYDKNDECKCDIVPARRTSDGAIGMYDKARNMFLENYGTGNFVVGPRAINIAITNSSATISSLRVNVDEGVVSTNADVVVSGNVRLVKNGDGTYFVTKPGQTYTAGTDIDAGAIRVNGWGSDGLFGAVAGNIVKNGGFDDEGTVVPKTSKKDWSYANANTFNCPVWTMSNRSFMGLSGPATGYWISNQTQINNLMGRYGFFMKTADKDGKGHSGDLSLSQGGIALSRGRYRISYHYTTRADISHAPAKHVVNLIHGNVTNKVGESTVQYDERTQYNPAEWYFDIAEEDEGEYTLQFLQTIADNGSEERTTVLDNIVVEKVSAADIVVNTGATLELAPGARDFSDYLFVMNGGTLLDSSGAGTSALISSMKLLDDSTWENTSNGGFIAPDSGDTLLDLGGNTLTVLSENSKILYFKNTTISNGTLVLPEHLYVNFEGSGVDASTAKIVSENLFKVNAPTVLGDFEERRTAASSHTASKTLAVCGTFKPVTTLYPALTLRDGATLDLSSSSSGISVASPGLTFEDNATIAIRLGGNHVSNPLVSWTTAPANLGTLTFVKAEGESGYTLEVRDNGLYVKRGFIITVF